MFNKNEVLNNNNYSNNNYEDFSNQSNKYINTNTNNTGPIDGKKNDGKKIKE